MRHVSELHVVLPTGHTAFVGTMNEQEDQAELASADNELLRSFQGDLLNQGAGEITVVQHDTTSELLQNGKPILRFIRKQLMQA